MRTAALPPEDLPPLTRSVAACLAAILEIETAEVPAPPADHPEPWTAWRVWLATRGLGLVADRAAEGVRLARPVARAAERRPRRGRLRLAAGRARLDAAGREFADVEAGYVVARHHLTPAPQAARRRRHDRGARGRAGRRGPDGAHRQRAGPCRPRPRGRPLLHPRGHVLQPLLRRPRPDADRGRGRRRARPPARRGAPQRRHARHRPQRARRPALPRRRGRVRRPPPVRAVRPPPAPHPPGHPARPRPPRRPARRRARRRPRSASGTAWSRSRRPRSRPAPRPAPPGSGARAHGPRRP